MRIIKEIYGINKPAYQLEISKTERLALYHETGSYSFAEILGDFINVQTLAISNRYSPLTSNDDHAAAIREIVERLGSNTEATEAAISKHLTRAGLSFKFVSLTGYSQGDWADVVLYAEGVDDWRPIVAEWQAVWRGEVFTLSHETLKVYTAADGEQLGEWELNDSCGYIPLTNYYGYTGASIDWQTLAKDNFGITINEMAAA